MDKQNQIEEMARELCPHYDKGNCYYEFTEVCECCFGCEFCWAISQVLNAGYRKIHENEVVLTSKKDIQQFEWSKICDKMGIFKFAEKVRKETAEKFAEHVKMAFYYEFDELIPSIMADKIDEICKEIMEGKV